MDEQNNQDEPIDEIMEEVEELNFTDKMVGVLSEPGELFSSLSKLPIKTIDWIVPLLLVIIVAVVSNFVLMGDPEIKSQIIEKQMEQQEKGLQEAVEKGQMTQSQADEQMDRIAEYMENSGSAQVMISSVAIVIFTFIIFFIISGVFLLLAKFALSGTGNYNSSMLAYGMPHYIIVIQIVVMIISALAMGKMFMDTSVGSYMGVEKSDLLGWFLHKLDPLSIWFYAVVGIAYAKMFKSEDTTKYVIAIFAMWIGFTLLFHFIAQAFPFLKSFGL